MFVFPFTLFIRSLSFLTQKLISKIGKRFGKKGNNPQSSFKYNILWRTNELKRYFMQVLIHKKLRLSITNSRGFLQQRLMRNWPKFIVQCTIAL